MVTEPQPKGIRSGGRSERVLRAIEQSTIDELVEHGYTAMTINGIATRAGVHRTTIYRRWPDKDALVVHVLLELSRKELPLPDTGGFVEDLIVFGEALNGYLARPHVRAIISAAIISSGEFERVREQFWSHRLQRADQIVRRARRRGEVDPDCNDSLVIAMLFGPIYMRNLVQGSPMSDDEIAMTVRAIAMGLRGSSDAR